MDSEAVLARCYDGVDAKELAAALELPDVVLYETVSSTLDVAHEAAAAGAEPGTLVLAETQTAGRGRGGRSWSSPPGSGIWLSLIERPSDRDALEVLSLRIGMGAARALDPFSAEPIRLKWPNDLYVDQKKLAGTLVEVRWRAETPEWVAVGFGVNVSPPRDQPNATGLDAGTRRIDVLSALVCEIRNAALAAGPLTNEEIEEYDARDLARGKQCVEPVRGRVRGITKAGELLVEIADATMKVRSGSLTME